MDIFKANIPAIILFLVAAVLIFLDKEGWGWFVFAGLILSQTRQSD